MRKKVGTLAGLVLLGGALAGRFALSRHDAQGPVEVAVVESATTKLSVLDLEGRVHAIGGLTSARATVLVFLGTECPISNQCLPTLREIARAHAAEGVLLYGVVSDPTTTRAAALAHAREYQLDFPILFDASGELAAVYRPAATPEAFVLTPAGRIAYRGRIDDRFEAVGRPRAAATHRDLEDALTAVLRGERVATPRTTPVGCVFEAWSRGEARSRPITYARDVAPILGAHCIDCHHEGGVGPFALTSYAQARKRARMLAEITASRAMPPWHAAPDFGNFLDERRLSDREIATLAAWADTGAAEGDASDLPPVPEFRSSWRLGEPDLVVSMPKPFEVPASGPDIYRAFVIKAEIPEDEMVVGVEFRPGAPAVVHHCLMHLDNTGTARKLEERAGAEGEGYPSFGSPGFTPSGGLGGWVPGATPRFLPHGLARLMKKGSDIVIQVHYHPSGKVEHDQSRLALYFARRPVSKIVASLTLWNRDIDIPAGESHYTRTIDLTLPAVTLVAITPHMHLLGREMKVTAILPPRSERLPLVWVPDWDFRWQEQYFYEKPIELPAGTRIHVDALYDNSAENPSNPAQPPRRVHVGPETTDEMCICFLGIAIDKPEDLKRIADAVARGSQ